jgi:hypothetical protein
MYKSDTTRSASKKLLLSRTQLLYCLGRDVHRDVPVLQQQQEELISLSVNRTPSEIIPDFCLEDGFVQCTALLPALLCVQRSGIVERMQKHHILLFYLKDLAYF